LGLNRPLGFRIAFAYRSYSTIKAENVNAFVDFSLKRAEAIASAPNCYAGI